MKTRTEAIFFFTLLGILIISAGFVVYSINRSMNLSREVFEISLATVYIEVESCHIQCSENNLTYSSIDSNTYRCFCSNEDYEITTYRIKLNNGAVKKYLDPLLE